MLALERHFYQSLGPAAVNMVCSEAQSSRRVLREVLIGKVFPDILVGEWPQAPAHIGSRRLTVIECALLHSLSVRDATSDELAIGRWSGLSFSNPARVLFRLAQEGIVAQAANDKWHLADGCHLRAVRLTAIEAKLSRIEDALCQALTLRLFVHRAYVLLDAERVRIDREVERSFRRSGVGLLLGHSESVELVVDAVETKPVTFEWVVAADKLTHAGKRTLRTS